MKITVLGGIGQMGQMIVRDLVQTCKGYEIVIADRNEKEVTRFAQSFQNKNVRGITTDIMDKQNLVKTLQSSKVVIASIPYKLNLKVMQAALEAKCNYVDLGGLYHMTKKQLMLNNQFKKKNLVAVVGCGSTPGTTNVMARYGARLLDKVEKIYITFAAHDKTQYKTHFVVPYSMYTVFDEFSEKPVILTKEKIKFVKPMSGEEEMFFPEPIGKVTGYYTLHSELATFPTSFKNKGLRECWFKVTFDQDFVHDVNLLIEAGLNSTESINIENQKVRPIDVTVKVLAKQSKQNNTQIDDLEYIRVIMSGQKNKKNVEITLDCIAKSDPKNNISAGTKNTATPPSIVAQMITKGQVKEKGVLPPELCIEPKLFFDELSKRGIKIYQRLTKPLT